MYEFKNYHPAVNFAYFAAVILITVIYKHPLMLSVSFVGAIVSLATLSGVRKTLARAALLLPLTLAIGAVNPLFNHRGVTVLAYFPSGNPFTLESLLYGTAAALTLLDVILWFYSINEIFTSDKLIALGARCFPHLSLLFSITLRFLPKFFDRAKQLHTARSVLVRQTADGKSDVGNSKRRKAKLIPRLREGFAEFSALLTWALESSIETAESMKSRGYGTARRSAYELYRAEPRDLALGGVLLALLALSLAARGFDFAYFPRIKGMSNESVGVSSSAFALFCLIPPGLTAWRQIEKFLQGGKRIERNIKK